jgi:hypothetical protein
MHHLRPGQALRHARRPVVGRVVSREVLVELIELAVSSGLLHLPHDLFVPLLVAHGRLPFFARPP